MNKPHLNSHVRKAVVALLGAGAIAAAGAPAALASVSSFGPQSWSNGTQTGRYRAHVGYHYITLGCSGGQHNIDLRVDVIHRPDVSEGYYRYGCNINYQVYGKRDSYLPAYRGHFMQSHSSWYGSLKDNHR